MGLIGSNATLHLLNLFLACIGYCDIDIILNLVKITLITLLWRVLSFTGLLFSCHNGRTDFYSSHLSSTSNLEKWWLLIFFLLFFISEYQVCNYGFNDKLLGLRAYTAKHTRLKIAWNTESNWTVIVMRFSFIWQSCYWVVMVCWWNPMKLNWRHIKIYLVVLNYI